MRGVNLRNNYAQLSGPSFSLRKEHLVQAFKEGKYLRDPENRGKPAANPMTDPTAMEGMMGAMKGNMMMMIPQTLIMSWINAFFAGFVIRKLLASFPLSPRAALVTRSLFASLTRVIVKLPFPLTLRFKSMLQSGVATRDLDVRWVSSLSWYFLNLFGLQSIFIFILGNDNGKTSPFRRADKTPTDVFQAASQMSAQMAQMNPSGNMFQPGQDPDKLFQGEAENIEVLEHWSILDGVEQRLLAIS